MTERWKPGADERYYIVYFTLGRFTVQSHIFEDDLADVCYLKEGNYFPDEDSAQRVADKLQETFYALIQEEN